MHSKCSMQAPAELACSLQPDQVVCCAGPTGHRAQGTRRMDKGPQRQYCACCRGAVTQAVEVRHFCVTEGHRAPSRHPAELQQLQISGISCLMHAHGRSAAHVSSGWVNICRCAHLRSSSEYSPSHSVTTPLPAGRHNLKGFAAVASTQNLLVILLQ